MMVRGGHHLLGSYYSSLYLHPLSTTEWPCSSNLSVICSVQKPCLLQQAFVILLSKLFADLELHHRGIPTPSALGWCLRCLHFLCGILYKSCFPGRYRTYYGNDHTGIGEDDSCSLPSRSPQMCVFLCFLDVQTFLKLLITG